MPRHLQIRAPGHGKLPNNPNTKLGVDPLAFLGDNPWESMAEDILFGGLNTFLQIIDYATGLDLLPAAKMLEDAFVGSSLGGPAFDDFTSYLAQQPTTDATTGLPTPTTTASGLFSALLRWLTLGFGTLNAGESLLSQMISAAGGSGSTLDEFGALFTGLSSIAVTDITGLATDVETWLANGGALPSTTTATINNIIDLPGQLSTMFSPFNPPHLIGTGQITNVAQNLLKNPTFATPDSLAGELVWVYDTISHAGTGGSAKVVAAPGILPLLSDPIRVAANDVVSASSWTQWDSLVYTGSPISLLLNVYDSANGLLAQVPLQAAAITGATSSWVNLAGSHTITEAGAYWARLGFAVDGTAATAGSVWFSDSSLTKPNLLPQTHVQGLPDLATMAQDTLDSAVQALFGTSTTGYLPSDLKTALSAIPYPNVSGLLGAADVGSTIQDFVDHGVQGIVDDPGTLVDQSLATFKTQMSSFARFVGFVTSGAAPPNSVANIASNVDNTIKSRAVQKPPSANLDPTIDATFDLHQIWQNSTLPTVSATSGATVMGDITIRDGGDKQAVTWYGYPSGGNFSSITDFRVNVYSVNKTSNVRTLVHSSANIVGTVGTGSAPVFNSYNLPTQIACAAGDKLTAELAILGTGTYLVVGQTLSAQVPIHPTYGLHALTRASAAAPTTFSPPGVAGSPVSYTRSVPWLGLSGIAAQTQYTPVTIPFYSGGTFDPSNYQWANNIDIIVCGPGGHGADGSGYWAGMAGSPGGWNGATLTKAQWSTVTTTVSVTAGASQSPTTITVPGWGTLSGPAGANNSSVSGTANIGQPGNGPGDYTYNGQRYPGGAGGASPQANGSQPGGAGAGGNAPFTVGTYIGGGNGGDGIGYIRVYQ